MEPFELSIVIACYNEEPILRDSVRQLVEVLDSTRFSSELIFVDDCSSDRTRELILEMERVYGGRIPIRHLFHDRNVGRGGTVSDGFRIAQGEIAGFLDIDLEVHARYIPSCALAIRNGADVATALRVYRVYWYSLPRHAISRVYHSVMSRLLGLRDLQDTETGFKFFKREKLIPLLDEVEDKGWFWDTEVMVRAYLKGYAITEIPCLFMRRSDKVSKVNVASDTIHYLRKLRWFRRELRATKRSRPGA